MASTSEAIARRSWRAVLDANELIKAGPRDTLLRAAELGLYRPFWSATILDEVQRNLISARLTTAAGAQGLLEALHEAFPDALVTGYEALIPMMTNHPKERHVLAAAVAKQANVIVTENLRDFPLAAVQPHGLTVYSADSFLLQLFTAAPAVVVDLLIAQGQGLRHPRTLDAVLDSLIPHLPLFVAAVRHSLGR